jgi:uncharacterized protein (TIGR03067 family)
MHAMLLASTVALAAPALKDRPKGNADIVGEWVVESMQSSGRMRPPSKGELRYVFAADGKLTVTRDERMLGGDDRGYSFDPNTSPAAIDLIADTTEQESSVTRGIYKIEGDTMTLLVPRGRGERPTKFEVSRESPGTIYTLRRVKPKGGR